MLVQWTSDLDQNRYWCNFSWMVDRNIIPYITIVSHSFPKFPSIFPWLPPPPFPSFTGCLEYFPFSSRAERACVNKSLSGEHYSKNSWKQHLLWFCNSQYTTPKEWLAWNNQRGKLKAKITVPTKIFYWELGALGIWLGMGQQLLVATDTDWLEIVLEFA